MLWTELTSDAFAEAVKECDGLCLLPIGCIERHGPHLPLGTDQIAADELARRAAEAEPAIVFPSYYFGCIYTARHYPGTVAIDHRLLLPVLEATVNEIARNGLKKILIVNGHGGNTKMLKFFLRTLLEEPRDYVVYATDAWVLDQEARKRWDQMRESEPGAHAGESETSSMMYLRPGLVQMKRLTPPEDGRPRRALEHLPDLETPLSWYADYPTHYAGDARAATPEKGKFLFQARLEKLVRQMQAVKSDAVSPDLLQQFYSQSKQH